MRVINPLTKEQLNITNTMFEAVLHVARQFGWQPEGTSPVKPQFADLWRRSYVHAPPGGARVSARDAASIAITLTSAWRALQTGEEGPALDGRVDARLCVEPERQLYQPVISLAAFTQPETKGLIWAVAMFLGRGGDVQLHGNDTLLPDAYHVARRPVRMTHGIAWTGGRLLDKGEVVDLPLTEAGVFLARKIAVELRADEAVA